MKYLLLVLFLPSLLMGAAPKPNIVLIFADDLGYGDLGCYGASKVKTPHIDKLATEGRKFTDAHSASAVCSPSRYGLMTGRYPIRKNFWGPTPHTQELTIETDRATLASVLKSADYATAVIGKWHLGFGKGKTDWNKPLKPGPLELGFDYYFGMPTVNSGPPFVYVENHGVVDYDPNDPFVYGKKSLTQKWPAKGGGNIGGADKAHLRYRDEYVGTTFAEKAVGWMKEHHAADKKKPFFLYLATTNIHHPFTPHPRFKGTSECGRYGDFVHELDWIVGEVTKTLDELGVADNTLIVFTSDNGGMLNEGGQDAWRAGHRLNGKLLGAKFGAWEGGHRVPLIVRWPGKVPAGTESHALVSQIDLITTFAEAAGTSLPKNAVVDGVSQLKEFKGTAKQPAREELVISPNSPRHLTLRKGKWVYIPDQDEGGFQGKSIGNHTLGGAAATKLTGWNNSDIYEGKIREDAPPAQLYNLQDDPYQTKNVWEEHPEVVAELSSRLKEWRKKIPPGGSLGWININMGNTGKAPQKPSEAAPKIPATPSKKSATFDFESGKIEPWKIVEGQLGHLIGSRNEFFGKGGEYNKQGKYYLTTLESSADAQKGSDSQTGVVVSPLFIPEAGEMSFRVGGGSGLDTYIALCTEDGKEVAFARGVNSQSMQKAQWDLTPYAGKKMFIKIVDKSTSGWGHITADNFQFDGKILTEQNEKQPPSEPVESQCSKPNIIFMLTDDLGYSDISSYGAQKVKTPHIDRLANEGFKSTAFLTGASICSPSRAAFLTGAYPQRTGLYMGINPNRKAHWFLGLHPDEITIAEHCKANGYDTFMVGKWHLGTEPEFLPRKQGFDDYYGMPCNFSHSTKFLENDKVVHAVTPLDQLTTLYTDRVKQIIKKQAKREKPFFLYFAHNYPHTPYKAGVKFTGSSEDGVRGDIIEEMDWGVGEMMKALEEAGVADNTIVIFTSDNGPTDNQYAQPFRGTKYVTFEGGHRVPFIFHWPTKIKESIESDVQIHAMDLFPTLSEIIGAKLPQDRVFDGESLLPLFEGKALTRNSNQPFFYYNCENLQAVRKGSWKLHLPRKQEQLPFWDKNKVFIGKEQPVLYNLKSDQAESTDVAEVNPEVVKELLDVAQSTRLELGEFMKRGTAQRPTGSILPEAPIISHEKDWGIVPEKIAEALAVERQKRYPGKVVKEGKKRRK
jgi:arylsulfatase A